MVKLDSISGKIPLEKVQFLTSGMENTLADSKTGDIVKETMTYPSGIGLNKVVADKLKGECQIDISAKILGESYLKGINKENISEVVSGINKLGIIKLKEADISDFKPHRLDVTETIYPEVKTFDLLDSLKCGMLNPKYKHDPHRTNRKLTGVVFNPKAKTNNLRQIAYCKHTEISQSSKLKAHSNFFNKLGANFEKVREQARGSLRVETNLRSHANIKKYLGVSKENDSFDFMEILNSKKSPCYEVANQIFAPDSHVDLLAGYEGMSIAKWERNKGRETIAKECNYDLDLIRSLYDRQNNYSRNNSRNMDWYIANVERLRYQNGFRGFNSEIKHYLELLKEVA